ncbi:MAG: lysine--tRNA ligase [Promethearchaeota archaeon]
MNENYPSHWLETIVRKIQKRDVSEITLSTGKTPSGHIHIGILREILICDALRRIFEDKNKKVRSYLFIDSLDAAKRFPQYIDEKFQLEHLGKPFSLIPCPFKDCQCENYAYHFGTELKDTFNDFGIKNKIIWTHELYKQKEMQQKIQIALEKTNEIKEILKKYILPTLDVEKSKQFIEMQKTWIPVMAICEKCNRIQFRDSSGNIFPNRVINYDSEKMKVSYECPACHYKGEYSIFSGKLKLNWRIDWPAKWAIFKVICEPAGKDHCVKGGAYDSGLEICKKIFGYEGPIKVAYEWLRLEDKDMKTSKGIVFTPKKYLEIADPEIFRMLILRTNPMKHISLRIEEMPQYYDYLEKMEDIYYGIKNSDSMEEEKFFKYLYPLIKINGIPNKKPIRIPFNLLVFFSQIQNILSIKILYKKAEEILNLNDFQDYITLEEFEALLKRTKKWVEEVKNIISSKNDPKIERILTQKINIFTIPEKIHDDILNNLDSEQRQGIKLLRNFLLENDKFDENQIQNKIFNIAKEELKNPPKKLFQALYQVILGKKSGPRLGSLIVLLDRNWILERLNIE